MNTTVKPRTFWRIDSMYKHDESSDWEVYGTACFNKIEGLNTYSRWKHDERFKDVVMTEISEVVVRTASRLWP